jgi:hypothetical protein
MTKIQNKKNSIPSISQDRLDNGFSLSVKPSSAEERDVYSFLKGKEPVQTLTTRIPKALYAQFRKIAFDKNLKMNQIIVQYIQNYVKKEGEGD